MDIIEKVDKALTDLIQQVKTSEPLTNKQTEYMKDETDTIWTEVKEIKAVLKNTNKQHLRTVGKAEKQNVETRTNLQPETTETLTKLANYFFKKLTNQTMTNLSKELKNIYPKHDYSSFQMENFVGDFSI